MILSDDKVKAVLFNIFGGITRCDEVANGLIEAFEQITPTVPVRRPAGRHERRRGPADPRRGRPARACTPRRRWTRRPRRSWSSRSRERPRDEHPRRQGHPALRLRHHRARGDLPRAEQQAATAPRSSSGVTPGKDGQDVEGIPVFNTFRDAVEETGANTAMVFVPPRFAADSILEAADAGIAADHRDHRGHPGARRAARLHAPQQRTADVRLVGPNCPGILSPGQGQRRHHPGVLLQGGQRRRRVALGHADLPDRQHAGPARLRQLVHRRHRRRPGPGLELHRRPRALRGRPADRAHRHGGRDRRLGRGGGRRLHRRARHQAGRRLHRGVHRAAGQDDGPRGRHRLRAPRARPRRRPRRSRPRACASGARRPRSPSSPSRSSAAEAGRVPARGARVRAAVGALAAPRTRTSSAGRAGRRPRRGSDRARR